MNRVTRHSASAVLEMLENGVLLVRLSGPLTSETMMHFKREIISRHCGSIRAYVADYRSAVVALTGVELDAVLDGEAPDATVCLPAAIVSGGSATSVFLGHTMRMAERGVMRLVFTDPAQAQEWAARQAARHRMAAQTSRR